MKHPTCSAEYLETQRGGPGRAVFLCVFHLIAGVAVALVAMAAFAIAPMFQ